jgi:hypothetical protein
MTPDKLSHNHNLDLSLKRIEERCSTPTTPPQSRHPAAQLQLGIIATALGA